MSITELRGRIEIDKVWLAERLNPGESRHGFAIAWVHNVSTEVHDGKAGKTVRDSHKFALFRVIVRNNRFGNQDKALFRQRNLGGVFEEISHG